MSDARRVLADLIVRANTATFDAQLRLVRFVFSLLNGPKFSLVADRSVMSREWVFGVRCRNCKAEQAHTVTDCALEDLP